MGFVNFAPDFGQRFANMRSPAVRQDLGGAKRSRMSAVRRRCTQ